MRNHENENAVTLPLITQGDTALVDARLLHQKLQVGKDFSTWITNRINEFGFKENQDFYPNLGKTSFWGGRPKKDYHLTLDMAKELAMLERNEVGRAIRRYFIAKEKEVRGSVKALPAPKEVFKGLAVQKINNRTLYPYRDILERCGYSRNSNGGRTLRYPQHFVKMGNILYITEEFATHLHHQRSVYINRAVMQASQPVLALDFGTTPLLPFGGTGETKAPFGGLGEGGAQ